MTTVDSILSKLVSLVQRYTTAGSANRWLESGDEYMARAALYPSRSVRAMPKEDADPEEQRRET